MKLSLTLYVISSLLVLDLSGQSSPENGRESDEPDTGEQTDEPVVIEDRRILFSVFVWPQQGILMGDSKLSGIPNVFYQSPTGVQPLDLAFNASTELQPYQGPSPLVFFDLEEVIEEPPPDAPPGTGPQRIIKRNIRIETEIPEKTDRVKIIVFPGRYKEDGTLRTAAISLDSERLRPGNIRLYNGSSRELALQFESRTNPVVIMEPNSHKDFNTTDFSSNTHARIFVYGKYDNKPRLFHTSKLYFTPGESNLLLLYPKSRRRFDVLNIGSLQDIETDSLFPTPTPESDPANAGN
jgi:hypothetical protein